MTYEKIAASNQVRSEFLRFFEEKGHRVIPSSSLIPHGDPTLLLTTAGMVQFKPYFTGEAAPPSRRLASCQKCFRTTDIETVGDTKHLTFFEMLGNFSIGDYFKQEAIEFAWEFVTRRLGLPPERLWITVFLDDDAAFGGWRALGVPEGRIQRFGEKDNFWGPAGDTGPCGPSSELHFDFGPQFGCGKPTCGPGCECPRFVELWNLVFTEFYQDEAGRRTPLPMKNIDTGMGLERAAAVLLGHPSFYGTDLFRPLLRRVEELAGLAYGESEARDRAMRVVAEHGRALAFLIADGVTPSNEGRGYILRRVLRRAALFGRKLGLEGPFLGEVAKIAISQMDALYPELGQNQDFILRVLALEEAKFRETLNLGLGLLEEVLAGSPGAVPGEKVFRLYDTYGFPKELTAEVAAERGLAVDWAGFDREMAAQRERARAAHRFGGGKAEMSAYLDLGLTATPFTGYEKLREETYVLALLVDGEPVSRASQGQRVEVVLAQTPFYGEMGGQVGDSGRIRGPRGLIAVEHAFRPLPEVVAHRGQVMEGELAQGDVVEAEVAKERRLDIARNHTATHLLHAALRQVLGSHARQAGSLVTPDRLRFDFTHLAPLTPQEREQVERLVNERIRQDLEVQWRLVPYQQALAEGAIALFDEKYGELVRLVEVRDDASFRSAELCGGTHLGRTGEIGSFWLTGEESIGSGLRRLEAVTGRGAEEYVRQRLAALEEVGERLEAQPLEAAAKVSSLLAELEKERKRAARLERDASRRKAEALLSQVKQAKGVPVLAAQVAADSMEALREIGDILRERLGQGVIALGASFDGRANFLVLVSRALAGRGLHAGNIARHLAEHVGGGGGGRPEVGQGGGKDIARLDEALALVKGLLP